MIRLKGIAQSGGTGTRLYRWPGGQQAERSNPIEFLPKSHLLGLLDAVENILARRKVPNTATVSPLRRRGLGYRTIQRGLRRSVQTQG